MFALFCLVLALGSLGFGAIMMAATTIFLIERLRFSEELAFVCGLVLGMDATIALSHVLFLRLFLQSR